VLYLMLINSAWMGEFTTLKDPDDRCWEHG
jgi:hypothetical protein